MARHIIHFTGPINSSTCGNLINTCSKALQQGADILQLNIATMGGECSYGFTLYNYLRGLPVPLHTHNLGTVESMGNILFLAGEHRTACAAASSCSIRSTGRCTARWTMRAWPNMR